MFNEVDTKKSLRGERYRTLHAGTSLVRAFRPSVIDYRVKLACLLACLLANILNDISKFCILFFANYFANITKRKQNQAFPDIISTKIINDGTQMTQMGRMTTDFYLTLRMTNGKTYPSGSTWIPKRCRLATSCVGTR